MFDRLVTRWRFALNARRALGVEPVEAIVPYPLTGLGGRPRLDAGMVEVSALRRTEGQEAVV